MKTDGKGVGGEGHRDRRGGKQNKKGIDEKGKGKERKEKKKRERKRREYEDEVKVIAKGNWERDSLNYHEKEKKKK